MTEPVRIDRRRLLSSMVVLVAGGAALAAGGAVLGACSSDGQSAGEPDGSAARAAAAPDSTAAPAAAATTAAAPAAAATATVFAGPVEGSGDAILIALATDPGAAPGSVVRAYVCDGVPTANGGLALWFKATVADGAAGVADAGKSATLRYRFEQGRTAGSVTLPDGSERSFDLAPTNDGSGVYDVTVGEDGSYVGVSKDTGAHFEGTMTDLHDPSTFAATLTLANGATFDVVGATPKGIDFDPTIVPGTFTAVARHVDKYLAMAGRSGDVRGGSPGLNIINIPQED